jgi:hypothetical protein
MRTRNKLIVGLRRRPSSRYSKQLVWRALKLEVDQRGIVCITAAKPIWRQRL